MRPHWRVDAPRHLFDLQAQRPHESLADLRIRQRLQSWYDEVTQWLDLAKPLISRL